MYYLGDLRIFSSSAVGLEHFNIEGGGKVVLPPSVLAEMSDFSGLTPMLFRLIHPITEVMTHCGVIEFSAEEGSVIAPSWVLDQIGAVSGDTILVSSFCLPVGTYARFKPQSTCFLDIANQKAVLESRLRDFSCLTCGDLIPIHYNERTYVLKVVATRPGDAICIVNCDLEVEFEEPVGYVVPNKRDDNINRPENENNLPSLVESLSFSGPGYRLDGKTVNDSEQSGENNSKPIGIPDFDWKIGTLCFNHDFKKPSVSNKNNGDFSPFSGSGRSLK